MREEEEYINCGSDLVVPNDGAMPSRAILQAPCRMPYRTFSLYLLGRMPIAYRSASKKTMKDS